MFCCVESMEIAIAANLYDRKMRLEEMVPQTNAPTHQRTDSMSSKAESNPNPASKIVEVPLTYSGMT